MSAHDIAQWLTIVLALATVSVHATTLMRLHRQSVRERVELEKDVEYLRRDVDRHLSE